MKMYKPEDLLTFGKCKGETLQDIYKFNPGYIEWLIKYTDIFFIDVDDFKLLPTPTPYFVKKKIENLEYWDERSNTVREAQLAIKKGVILPEKEFQFSDETIQILEQKQTVPYKAPPYIYVSDIIHNSSENDFM